MTETQIMKKLDGILKDIGGYTDFDDSGNKCYHLWGDLLAVVGLGGVRFYVESTHSFRGKLSYESIESIRLRQGEISVATAFGRWV